MRAYVVMPVVGCLAAAALTVVTTAPGNAGTVRTAAAVPQRVRWGRCSDASLRSVGAKCGFVRVPMDYSNPAGPTVRIAVSRVRHTVPRRQYQGVMLVNPGGPGGSGLGFAALGGIMPGGSGKFYDWIGFDPRGVGASRPALSCLPGYFHGDRPPYIPTTHAIRNTWLARARSYVNACEADAPVLLRNMRTVDVARDMNQIRLALGKQRINYYGYSYGTYLGQVFATRFPGRVRRMVLDSNVNPTTVFYQANLDQGPAFERVIQHWFAWIARHHTVYRLGKTRFEVQRLFYQTEQSLRRRPAGGVVGPSEWDDAFLTPGYAQVTWPDFASVFSTWVRRHKPRPLIHAYRSFDTPGDDNGFAVYNAVQCTDARWPTQWARWARDNWRLNRVAPFLTWGNAWFNAGCRIWPVQGGPRVHVNGHKVRALLLDETLDAATPYRGSLTVRNRFPKSSLVATKGGTTHAASPNLSPRCVNTRIAAYLRTGKLPPRRPGRRADVTCRPLPPPRATRAQGFTAALPPTFTPLVGVQSGH